MLPEPEGPRQGIAGTGEPLRLLITGDSSAAGVGAETQEVALSGQLAARLAPHVQVNWQLHATTGHRTRDTIARLQALNRQKFDIALIALGVNDVTRANTQARFLAQQAQLWELLQARFGVRQILCCGVPPMAHFPLLPQPLAWVLGQHALRLDTGLAALASQSAGVSHLPLVLPRTRQMAATDGFHPSTKAYAIWAENLAKHILTEHL